MVMRSRRGLAGWLAWHDGRQEEHVLKVHITLRGATNINIKRDNQELHLISGRDLSPRGPLESV